MRKTAITALALVMAAGTAIAGDGFDDIVTAIVDNNPAISASTLGNRADRLDRAGENTLPDPSVDLSRVWGSRHVGNKLQLDVAQEFDWPGLYGARSRAADAAAEAADMAVESARLDLAVQARQLLVELVYVRRQLEVLEGMRAGFDKLSAAIDLGVRGGEFTVIDQRKMQIEAFEIDTEIDDARSREQALAAELQALAGRSLDLSDIRAYPVQPQLTLEQYLDKVASDPAVASMRLSARAEDENARVASMSRFPGFSVGYQHQAEMGDRFNGFTVGVRLPFFRGSSARRAAGLRAQAADAGVLEASRRRAAEVESAYAAMQIERARVKAYMDTFGDNKYLGLLLRAYEGGQMTVIEYLSEVHYYHQAMLTYLQAEYSYNQALTTLNR